MVWRTLSAPAVVVLLGAASPPCLWDSDTLATELRGLPDAFDLVTGRWHRHCDEYYRERIRRLGGRDDVSLADLDDLAVAHEHLGQRAEAIAVMRRKAALLDARPDPEHRYRQLANFGTFLAHDGRYEEAATVLRQAVALNPDAHFGRESFQIELVEYVAAAQKDPAVRERSFLEHAGYGATNVSAYGVPPADAARDLDLARAYDAVAGMLRFGGREGPELYRSLGEIFARQGNLNLAWWATRRAIERGHPAEARLRAVLRGIEDHWAESRTHDKDTGVRPPTDAEYAAIRAAADEWVTTFQRLERDAIARGEDVRGDDALAALLADADRLVPRILPGLDWTGTDLKRLAGLGAAILLVVAVVLRRRRQRARA